MRKTIIAMFVSALFLCGSLFAQEARVEIDSRKTLRPVNPWLYGINTARWDESLFPGPTDEMLTTADRDAIAKIKASGVTVLKYPGGNDADKYVWNSTSNNASEMDTDEYMALCRAVGAEPFITINFNEPPELAAEWVRHCNIVKGYNVKLWEVGDERWGKWVHGYAPPEEYAKKYVSFVKAMRAVDPSIKVATNAPLGSSADNWTERVLKAAGDHVDMLTYTYFPQSTEKENDETLLKSPAEFRTSASKLREDVIRAVGKEKAEKILFINVGYNSVNHSPGPQTLEVVNAIWTADMLGSMAEVGTDIACFWALHNAYPPRKGDYGYISSDASNTPSYTYFVFPMLSQHLKGTMVATTSDDASVSAYSSRHESTLSVVLINKDKEHEKTVELTLKDFAPRASAKAWVLDEKRKYIPLTDIANASERFAVTLALYSIVAVDLVAKDAVIPPANLAASATATASSFSTIGREFSAASAIDSKLHTRWNSAAWTKSDGKEAQWFQLEWPEPQTIGFVRIRWGETYASDYKLLSSVDGKKWDTLHEATSGKGGVEEIALKGIKSQHLKIDGSRGAKGISAYSIREIEVYERPATTQPATKPQHP